MCSPTATASTPTNPNTARPLPRHPPRYLVVYYDSWRPHGSCCKGHGYHGRKRNASIEHDNGTTQTDHSYLFVSKLFSV
jgi:hypothetical protein